MRNFREVKTVEAADELLAYLRRQVESDPSEMAEQEIRNLQARRRLLVTKAGGEPEPQADPEPSPRVEQTPPAPPPPKPRAKRKEQPTEKPKSTRLFYERQEGEPSRAFNAFAVYRNQGALRSLRKAAAEFYGSGTTAKPHQERQFFEWSRTWMWTARVEAFDAEQREHRRREREEQADDARDRAVRGAQMLQRIALKGLMQVDGRFPNPEENPPRALLDYYKQGVELEFLGLGLPISVIRQEVEEAPPSSVEDMESRRRLDSIRRLNDAIGRNGR